MFKIFFQTVYFFLKGRTLQSILYCMTNDYENLRKHIKSLYLEQDLTDTELNDMADRLIKLFSIGAKAVFETKRTSKGTKEATNN